MSLELPHRQVWDTAGLIKPSVIKAIFTTVEKGLVVRRL
jgi:hypothetical protein